MARRQMFEGGTKERIAEVGGRMIFEKGYEGTSVRSVMEEVGADVGVFYYYFPSPPRMRCFPRYWIAFLLRTAWILSGWPKKPRRVRMERRHVFLNMSKPVPARSVSGTQNGCIGRCAGLSGNRQ